MILYSGWNDWNHFYGEGPLSFAYDSALYNLHIGLTRLSLLYAKGRNLLSGYRALIYGEEYKNRALRVWDQGYFTQTLRDNLGRLLALCKKKSDPGPLAHSSTSIKFL